MSTINEKSTKLRFAFCLLSLTGCVLWGGTLNLSSLSRGNYSGSLPSPTPPSPFSYGHSYLSHLCFEAEARICSFIKQTLSFEDQKVLGIQK